MNEGRYPACAWQGLDETTDLVVWCHRFVVGYATRRSGERIYACLEHASHVKVAAEGGEWDWLPPEGVVPAGTLHAHHEIVARA